MPTIPIADIEPFLSKPLVIAQDQLVSAPRIVHWENRVALRRRQYCMRQRYHPGSRRLLADFRAGPVLVDPDTQESLGYQAISLGKRNANIWRCQHARDRQIAARNLRRRLFVALAAARPA
jgi:hypothetical protein